MSLPGKKLLLPVLMSIAPLATVANGAVIIDTFSALDPSRVPAFPQVVNTNVGAPVGGLENGLAGVIGGIRGSQVGSTTMDVLGLDNATINIVTAGGGLFDFSSTVGAKATAFLDYGAPGTAALNYNGTGDGFLTIDLAAYDGPATASLQIQASITSGASTFNLPLALVVTPGAQTINIPLASLTAPTLADIDGIHLSFNAPKGGDFRINTISTTLVPEPASFAVIGLAGMAAIRRRSR